MRVLCINDNFILESVRNGFKCLKQLPVEGEVYTISKQRVHNGQVGLILKELDNPNPKNGRQFSFKSERFVLLQDEFEEVTYSKVSNI